MPTEDRVKPLRVVAKLRNNRLIRAREKLGHMSTSAAARAIGISAVCLCKYEALHLDPKCRRTWAAYTAGDWRPVALKIAMAYGVPPDYLWPEELGAVTGTQSVVEIDVPQMHLEPPPTPDKALESGELRAAVAAALHLLTPMEANILRLRFGLDGEELTYNEIGAKYDLSRERIRQLEKRALGKVESLLARCACGHRVHGRSGCAFPGCPCLVEGANG